MIIVMMYININVVHPYSKIIGIYFAMSKTGIQVQNIDLQFYELCYEVIWCDQVIFHDISFVLLVSVVVLSQ